jgi:hypothetical protein
MPCGDDTNVGYFYLDGIVKYDAFSTCRIDRTIDTISKETLYFSSQRYNAKISIG